MSFCNGIKNYVPNKNIFKKIKTFELMILDTFMDHLIYFDIVVRI